MSFKHTLNQLLQQQDLSFDEMNTLMHQVMAGELTPAQIAAVLVALRMKGESVNEIAAAATVMRQLSSKVTLQQTDYLIDTCGTGGDGIQTFNISTASALVAAAAGARVAKHGGRSVSSTCGSADVLEKLGVNVSLNADQVAACVNQTGIGFMFAPNHHSAMKHAAPVRRELGVRTLFNLLGPLTNPAGANRQVLGVFDQSLTGKIAQVLKQLGSEHVMVVHGADGMDEISISTETYIAELKAGEIHEYRISPQTFGFPPSPLETLKVSNVEQAQAMLLDVLNGHQGPPQHIVLLNAGAAIYTAGLSNSLEDGISRAHKVIMDGSARRKLEQLVQVSNQAT